MNNREINTQLMEGFRPVSEMIAEHKQDPKKAAAIEKAKMRKAEQEPVAFIGQGLKPIVPEDLEKLRKHEPGTATLYDTSLYAAPVRTKDYNPEVTFNDDGTFSLTLPDGDELRIIPPQQEPTAEVSEEGYAWGKDGILPAGTKLYAAPIRTKDLTDSEIATLVQRHTIDGKIMPFALCEAVIAADREKNK